MGGARHGFLDERVFASQQTCLGHREMQMNAGGDNNRVQVGAVEEMFEIRLAGHPGIQGAKMLQALLVGITNRGEAAVGNRSQISNQVGTPVSQTDHPNFCSPAHLYSCRDVCTNCSEDTLAAALA